ncbi:hypothetical protein [Uliginosibacterium gangwonense]|uniref:hypothetical protein n=1 Tax=Uliginosibacterium gangwonense TaxID=392736 RepID=UPI000475A37D|nr:hypothetical protein [Uliginosibacterium gangwonense]
MTRLHWMLVSAFCVASTLAGAENGPPPANGANPPGPPAEAFTACNGKKAGDKVTVKMGDHSMQATCEVFPGNGKLAARPDGPPPGASNSAPPPKPK